MKRQKNTKKQIKRQNASIYPIYKMFSWDLVCFYSIQFLFYTMTKEISASQVLIVNAIYLVAKVVLEVPSIAIVDLCEHRKSLVIGNFIVFISMIVLIYMPGFWGVACSNIISALGFNIKNLSETNLLYDSVSTKGGEGLYTKIDSIGSSLYYYLDGVLCLIAGYLFVIDNYMPIYICTACTLISTILAFGFKNIHKNETNKNKNIVTILNNYVGDLKTSVKFITKSNRMKAYLAFGSIFLGIIKIVTTYKSALLIEQGISEEEYSSIFAILTLFAGISAAYSNKFHKKFRKKTLTVLSLVYVGACLMAAIAANSFESTVAIPIIIIACLIFRIGDSLWFTLQFKYLKNFTTEKSRNKIAFVYDTITCIGAIIMSLFASFLLEVTNINDAMVLVSLIFIIMIVLVLDYMRNRIGLKPSQYKKEDINF